MMDGSYDGLLPLAAFCLAILVHGCMIRLSLGAHIFLDSREKVQKVHRGIRPRIGGAGIFVAVLFFATSGALGGYLLLSALPVFLAGILEDYRGNIRPWIRLAIMMPGALMLPLLLPELLFAEGRLAAMPAVIVIAAIVVLLLTVSNGVNFIDGHNGLAAGSCLLSVLPVWVLSFSFNDAMLQYYSVILLAALLAFLCFNFPKGRLFLGDGGAYLSGFLTAALVLLLVARHQNQLSVLLLPLLLIYPIWEVFFSVVRRLFFEHTSPFRSDQYHLHQLIYKVYGHGIKSRPAVILLPFQAGIGVLSLLACDRPYILLLSGLAFCIAYCAVYYRLRRSLIS